MLFIVAGKYNSAPLSNTAVQHHLKDFVVDFYWKKFLMSTYFTPGFVAKNFT